MNHEVQAHKESDRGARADPAAGTCGSEIVGLGTWHLARFDPKIAPPPASRFFGPFSCASEAQHNRVCCHIRATNHITTDRGPWLAGVLFPLKF